jgi:hypothetical protein
VKGLFGKDIDILTARSLPSRERKYFSRPPKRAHWRGLPTSPDPKAQLARGAGTFTRMGAVPERSFMNARIARRKATGGPGTDIRLKNRACSQYEPRSAS